MKVSGAECAVVEIEKLRDYCLNPVHPRGRHKARVFAAVPGLTAADAELLRAVLLKAITENDAVLAEKDEYGQRYIVDFIMRTAAGRAIVRSAWIVRQGENYPRLTTCYIL